MREGLNLAYWGAGTTWEWGAPAYLGRRDLPTELSELSRHNWVQYTPLSSRLTFRRGDRAKTVTLKGRLRTNSGNAAMVLLREGYGLTLAPLWIVREDFEAGRLKAVLTDYEARRTAIYAVYPEGKNLLPKVKLFVNSLVQSFGAMNWTKIDPAWIAGN